MHVGALELCTETRLVRIDKRDRGRGDGREQRDSHDRLENGEASLIHQSAF